MKRYPAKKDPMTDQETRTATTIDITPMRSELLSGVPGVIHGLTHRVAGMGKADGNVGYSTPRDKDDAWAMRQAWAEAIVAKRPPLNG